MVAEAAVIGEPDEEWGELVVAMIDRPPEDEIIARGRAPYA